MEGYRGIVNLIAYNQLATSPDLPAEDLAIGNDEIMNSIGVFIPTEYVPIQQRLFIPTGAEVPFEKMELDGEGATLAPSDFITSGEFFGGWTNRGY